MTLNRLLFLIKSICQSVNGGYVCLQKTDTKKICYWRRLDCAQIMITTLGSSINVIGGPMYLFEEHKNILIYTKVDIYLSSKICEESGYCLNLGLLTISYYSRVS